MTSNKAQPPLIARKVLVISQMNKLGCPNLRVGFIYLFIILIQKESTKNFWIGFALAQPEAEVHKTIAKLKREIYFLCPTCLFVTKGVGGLLHDNMQNLLIFISPLH